MRNRYLEQLNKRVRVRIVGSNINNYLKRVIKNKINVIHLNPVSYREVHVILEYSEYKKLLKLKSIYEISVMENLGGKKFEETLGKNAIMLMFIVLGLFLIMFLSRVVFSVDVIHQDSEIRELLKSALKKEGIVKYSLKKNYEELEGIRDRILEDNKHLLEWIEISSYGTKYIVRVEERKLNEKEDEFRYQSIVSKKEAVLTKVEAIRGEKIKGANEHVKAGEVVISGYITRPDNSKVPTKAEGTIYGEVWYEVEVDYPIVYQETNLTGNSKTVYAFYFFGRRISLFDFDNYRSFEAKQKVLVSSNFLDIKFVREKQFEAEIKDEVYTEEIAKVKAIDYIKSKMIRDNKDIIEISDVKILEEDIDEDSVSFKLFVKAIEDIGEVVVIDEIREEGSSSLD